MDIILPETVQSFSRTSISRSLGVIYSQFLTSKFLELNGSPVSEILCKSNSVQKYKFSSETYDNINSKIMKMALKKLQNLNNPTPLKKLK